MATCQDADGDESGEGLSEEMREKLAVHAPDNVDDDRIQSLAEEALDNIRGQVQSNRRRAEEMGHKGEPSVDEVLDPDNIREIKVRAKPCENPRITVWLGSTRPHWANDAWRDDLRPFGLNAYNGKVKATLDVRPQ